MIQVCDERARARQGRANRFGSDSKLANAEDTEDAELLC